MRVKIGPFLISDYFIPQWTKNHETDCYLSRGRGF